MNKIKISSNRNFGLVFFTVFLIIRKSEIKNIAQVGKERERGFSRYIERRSSESNFFKKEFEKVM